GAKKGRLAQGAAAQAILETLTSGPGSEKSARGPGFRECKSRLRAVFCFRKTERHGQGWHRWRYRLYGSRNAAVIGAASAGRTRGHYVAPGSRKSGKRAVPEPARP